MPQGVLEGLVKRELLNETELGMIRQLVAACEDYEHLHMRIEWSMLQGRMGVETNDFFYYRDGILVGYLALDDRGATENEVVGMVHPDHRRSGIFRQLLNAALEECRKREIKKLELICEHDAQSGQACMHALGAELEFSEHEMLLMQFNDHYAFDDRLYFRQADGSDIDALVRVQSESFDSEVEVTRRRVMRCLQDVKQQYYLATLGGADVGCDEPVGVLRLDRNETMVGIYGFCVRPDYQGRGYARQMLVEAIKTIRAQDHERAIMLDVDLNNTRAFNLYHSCGFRIRATYDYYVLNV